MASIKDRAEYYAKKWLKRYYYKVSEAIEAALIVQDRVARNEERERCIRIAEETTCFFCECRICPQMRMSDCEKWKKIRIAIEKGGNQ